MEERVTIAVEDGIADVRLNRPDKLNAIDGAMFKAVADAGARLAGDASLRAVVISGEGRSFCAGLDFASFQSISSTTPRSRAASPERPSEATGGGGGLLDQDAPGIANNAQRPAWVWRELPVPVIAAVHGVAYGGGLQIALGADIRLVAPDARLSVREVHWGLIPDMTGTQTLRHLVRLDVAKELTFTGRIVSGSEAVALGLATQVCDDPRSAAFELAREIAGRSPHAVRAAKQLLTAAPLVDPAEGLALEARLQRGLLGSPNMIEAIRANMEKREPRFEDPEPE